MATVPERLGSDQECNDAPLRPPRRLHYLLRSPEFAPLAASDLLMSAPKPTATVTLAVTPLPLVLVHALDRRLTGTLVIESPERHRSAITLERGVVAKAKSGLGVHFLGEILLDLGSVERGALEAALRVVAAERRLLGQVLESSGRLTRVDLMEALREQVRRKVGWMCDLSSASVAGYYDGVNLLERWGGPESTQVTPHALLWHCVRDHGFDSDVDAALAKLGPRTLKLHREAPIASYRFSRLEQNVIDVLRVKPQPLAQLEQSGVAERRLVRRMAYVFTITRAFDLGSASAPPWGARRDSDRPGSRTGSRTGSHTGSHTGSQPPRAVTTRRPVSSSPPTSPGVVADDSFAAEVRERSQQVSKQTLYEILGVEAHADTSVIQAAFFQLARRWHPDRIPPELDAVRDQAIRVFSRMSEAHAVLTDPQRRAEYNRLIKEGGATEEEQAQVSAVLQAAHAFQRAEVLVKRQKFDEAEAEAQSAAELDPEQVEYAALHTWLRSRKLTTPEELAPLIKELDAAIAKAREHLKLRLFRARLLQKAGRDEQAMRDYRFVVDKDPRHTEAQRELRLFRMRRGGPSSRPPAETGLFGKLFKR